MGIAALLLASLLVAASGPGDPVRWSVEIRGSTSIERAELRLKGRVGQVLMGNADSAFQALPDLRISGDSISFTVGRGQRAFAGLMEGGTMHGTVRDPDGNIARWTAVRIPDGSTFTPIDRRFTVRQLVVGGDSGIERVPGAWVAAMPDSAQLETEYRELARAAALPAALAGETALRPRRLALGFDSAWRNAERAVLQHIAASPVGDPVFRHLFIGSNGVRLDIYDVAMEDAQRVDPGFHLADALRALRLCDEFSARGDDSASIRESAWLCWSHITRDRTQMAHQIQEWQTQDVAAATALQALLLGYDEAVRWWHDAVHWLLTSRWLDTPAGKRSPAELVAAFWGRDSVPLPDIVTEPYGDFEAFPALGGDRLGTRLVRPLNASAAEAVAANGTAGIIKAWSQLGAAWGEALPVVAGGMTRYVTSPSAMNHTHAGGFIADHDLIRIDAGITPLIAVGIVVHEWQHLIIGAARLQGAAPGLLDGPTELRLRADDPWLAEGAAEWASEQALRPARDSMPLLALFDAEKRRALAALTSDDPHALGYRLVRAAAGRTGTRTVLQGRLVRLLHDLPAFAALSGFDGPSRTPPLTLTRPTSTAVIPEITFIWDGGSADQVTRRLIVPNSRPEH